VTVHTGEIQVSTRGDADVIEITGGVQEVIDEGSIDEGVITAFVRGSTAAITTMEFEPGGVSDLRDLLDRLVPVVGDYEHNRLNHDTNSHAHQRASLIGA
jgi:secondary thiamine-phosphate synthase enzyme